MASERHDRQNQGRKPRRRIQKVARTPQDDLDMVMFQAAETINKLVHKVHPGQVVDLQTLIQDLGEGGQAYDNKPAVLLGAGAQGQVSRIDMLDGTSMACKSYTINTTGLAGLPAALSNGGLMEVAMAWLGGKNLVIPGVLPFRGADIKINTETGGIDVRIFCQEAHMDMTKCTHALWHNPANPLAPAPEQQRLAAAPPGSRLLCVDDVYSACVPVLQGLAQLHALGVVHADVKPSNILLMLSDHGRVTQAVLADLGGSDFLDAGRTVCSKPLVGTPDYMSLARAACHNQVVSTADDCYAWGMTVMEALTGCTPGAHLDGWARNDDLLGWLTTHMDDYTALPVQHQAKGLGLMQVCQQGLAGSIYRELMRMARLAMQMPFPAHTLLSITQQAVGAMVQALRDTGASPYVVLPGDLMPSWTSLQMSAIRPTPASAASGCAPVPPIAVCTARSTARTSTPTASKSAGHAPPAGDVDFKTSPRKERDQATATLNGTMSQGVPAALPVIEEELESSASSEAAISSVPAITAVHEHTLSAGSDEPDSAASSMVLEPTTSNSVPALLLLPALATSSSPPVPSSATSTSVPVLLSVLAPETTIQPTATPTQTQPATPVPTHPPKQRATVWSWLTKAWSSGGRARCSGQVAVPCSLPGQPSCEEVLSMMDGEVARVLRHPPAGRYSSTADQMQHCHQLEERLM